MAQLQGGKAGQLGSKSSGTTMPLIHAEGEPYIPVWLTGKLVRILFFECHSPKPLHRGDRNSYYERGDSGVKGFILSPEESP